MSGRMQWNEAGAREASARVASMADAVQVQSRRLAAIAVSQGDATGMIRDLLGTWTTELGLRGEALAMWSAAISAQTDTVARSDQHLRLS